jgi:hypothetical protein
MFFRLAIAAITSVLIIATSIMFPGITAEKTVKPQVPGVYQFELGDFRITALSDGTVPLDLHSVLTNTNPTEIDRLLHHSFLTKTLGTSLAHKRATLVKSCE